MDRKISTDDIARLMVDATDHWDDMQMDFLPRDTYFVLMTEEFGGATLAPVLNRGRALPFIFLPPGTDITAIDGEDAWEEILSKYHTLIYEASRD